MNTKPTAYEKIGYLIRSVEKADAAYADITRRAADATDKNQLIDVYTEATRFGPDMYAAAAIMEIVEESKYFASHARGRMNPETWAPHVHAYEMDPEALTREINDRIFDIYRAEDAAETERV